MPSLQYVIDTICSSVSEESMYKLIEKLLESGAFAIGDIIPLIREKDRSLDSGSARMLADAALQELAAHGKLKLEGEQVYPVK